MNLGDDDVCIVGLGACTPVGRRWPAAAAAVHARVARFAEQPYLMDAEEDPVVVSSASWLDPDLSGSARLAALAAPAIREALDGAPAATLHTWLALSDHRPGRPRGLELRLCRRLVTAGVRVEHTTTLAGDHTSGLAAIAEARNAIRRGATDLALVVGVDSLVNARTLAALETQRRLYTPRNPWGFIPGEAAGAVLLTSPALAARRGLSVLGRCRAVAVVPDARPTARELGIVMSAAVQACLSAAPLTLRIAHRYCDLNGEPRRADELAFVTTRIADRLARPDQFVAPAACWGDVGAATAPLLIMLALAAAGAGRTSGPELLVTTSTPGGLRGAALLSSPPVARVPHV